MLAYRLLDRVKFYTSCIGIYYYYFTLAAPQFGSKVENVKRKGIEIILALDLQNGMNSKDLEPSRLERAKMGYLVVDKLDKPYWFNCFRDLIPNYL